MAEVAPRPTRRKASGGDIVVLKGPMGPEAFEGLPFVKEISREEGRLHLTVADAPRNLKALLDRCPHKGGPLSQGIVFGTSVACPLHNWTIGLADGCAQGADELRLRRHVDRPAKGLFHQRGD